MRKQITTAAAALGIAALAVSGVPAQAAGGTDKPGRTSLAEVLAADGLHFDHTWSDFDILDQAVNDVIGAKPDSPVALLADGDTELTAFAPTDGAFRRLVADLTGSKPKNEQATYDAVGGLGVDAVEQVLLYHVVPGAPITWRDARKADGARLTTAQGETVKVNVKRKKGKIVLVDQDRDDKNARIYYRLRDINKGNRQIAHGVSAVLRPFDL